MPILHRHVVPNVPALTAGNDAIVFRNGAPSHQAEMKFGLAWSGDVTAPYGTLTAAEITDALAHPDETPTFFYGEADEDWWPEDPDAAWYAQVHVGGYGARDITMRLDIGLIWSGQNNFWQWVAVVDFLSFDYEPSVLNSVWAVARFASAQTTQALRLGNGVQLPFSRMLRTEPDPDLFWRNTACSGCSITLSASYA